ncbi:MAG: glycosyltransferase family 4 protein [Rhodobacteraceae bacterium]|nr:glycosyltransferase family 4 protein [Paracoccaceae bacterium]
MTGSDTRPKPPALAVVVKGYPRLSETFVAQELAGLERAGVPFDIWSLRHPTDAKTHPIHDEITAGRRYLPEYLRNEPWRVLRAVASQLGKARFWRAAGVWLWDLARDRTVNRARRFGQAAVLARELPMETRFLYAHFLHTPASATRYAAIMRGIPWGFSAHAKDIWTTSDWEKREKIADCAFGVTCTASGASHLQGLAPTPQRVSLLYHGLDLSRFPSPPDSRQARDGSGEAVTLVSVGRLVAKKGYPDLLAALAMLPPDLKWRFIHIGGGPLGAELAAEAARMGISSHIEWRGAQAQTAVIAALREADLFVLPSRIAADGDRDGLPNVLMEAASQKLPVISTTISAIPEFVIDEGHGVLIAPESPADLAQAIEMMARNPTRRAAMAERLYARLKAEFGASAGIVRLTRLIAPFLSGETHEKWSPETRKHRDGSPAVPIGAPSERDHA